MISSTQSHQNLKIDQSETGNVSEILEKIPPWQRMLCEKQGLSLTEEGLKDYLKIPTMYRDFTPNVTSSNIFFIQSSCNPRPMYREWCSVESWAVEHPESDVWYILTHPLSYQPGMMADLFDHHPNIKVVGPNIEEFFKETPIWDLFHSYKWVKKSNWPPNNLSNIMRVVLVWRWGGFYSDADVICIKNTKDLSTVVGMISKKQNTVNNAIFHGKPHDQFYWNVMKDLEVNFQGNVWGHNGPSSLSRVTKKMCPGIDFEKLASKQAHCDNISLLPLESFYPIPYQSHPEFFKAGKGKDLEKRFNASYTLHFWNKLSKSTAIRVGSESIMDSAAKKYCPVTYRVAALQSNFF